MPPTSAFRRRPASKAASGTRTTIWGLYVGEAEAGNYPPKGAVPWEGPNRKKRPKESRFGWMKF